MKRPTEAQWKARANSYDRAADLIEGAPEALDGNEAQAADMLIEGLRMRATHCRSKAGAARLEAIEAKPTNRSGRKPFWRE